MANGDGFAGVSMASGVNGRRVVRWPRRRLVFAGLMVAAAVGWVVAAALGARGRKPDARASAALASLAGAGVNVVPMRLPESFGVVTREVVGINAVDRDLGGDRLAPLDDVGPDDVFSFYARNAGIDDRAAAHLARLTGLEQLTVLTYPPADPGSSGGRLTAAGLGRLAGLRKLRNLVLAGNAVDDDAVGPLGALPLLRILSLADTRVTGRVLKAFAGRPLTHLALDGCRLDAGAFETIATMTGLTNLGVARTGATEDDLRKLDGLARLKVITVDATVGAGVASRLKEAHPGLAVVVEPASAVMTPAAGRGPRPAETVDGPPGSH